MKMLFGKHYFAELSDVSGQGRTPGKWTFFRCEVGYLKQLAYATANEQYGQEILDWLDAQAESPKISLPDDARGPRGDELGVSPKDRVMADHTPGESESTPQ